INPTAHDFGAVIVDSSASQTFVLTNAGAADLVVSATDLTGTDAAHFKIESGGAPFTLAAGDSQNLVVSFTPTSEGAKSAALQILSNDPDEAAVQVSLTGNGIGALEIIVTITSPQDSAVVCTDSVNVKAVISVNGGSTPFSLTCDINRKNAGVDDKGFMAAVPLASGENLIVATCSVVDSLGRISVFRDSIVVFLDDIPPTCTFTKAGSSVIGTYLDDHSGIAEIVPIKLRNAQLTVDSFAQGDKVVNFRIDPIDPDKPLGFLIDVFDVCGNFFSCDPIYVNLPADQANRQFEFSFPHFDRYFQITNFGLTEVRVVLNGLTFCLFSDQLRAEQEPNAYFMPREGIVTLDLFEYLHDGENDMLIVYEGPSGAWANLLLLDIVNEVDFVLKLQTVPVEYRLSQNYPNPFNPTTTIQIDIPDRNSDAVQVQLRVYNLLGELVRVLVDERKAPGRYLVEWDGKDRTGKWVPSGVYFYQLLAGDVQQTKRMTVLQ
ncbi:MAG: choice-of-anchor D domain-containing protein, partial [bacterium]